MSKMAKLRWENCSQEDLKKHKKAASDRMKKYWIGWRQAKSEKDRMIKESVKKSLP